MCWRRIISPVNASPRRARHLYRRRPAQGAKIAALGLKVRGNGCTYHGVSLNVAMDLAPFSWINPVRLFRAGNGRHAHHGREAPLADVQQALADELVQPPGRR
jgi:lipoyl(octanoyl) transferase